MKTNFLLITLLLCFLVNHQSYAQLYEVSLKNKVDNSHLILEGQVTDTYSYQGNDGRIYTTNKIQVFTVLKGIFLEEEISVITLGGEFDDIKETWTHLLTLNKNEAGLFFLVPTDRVKPEERGDYYEVYSSSQGFFKYNYSRDTEEINIIAPFTSYQKIPDLYSDFKDIYDFTPFVRETIDWNTKFKEEDKSVCIDYQLDVSDVKIENSQITVSVDISVKSDGQNLRFLQGAVVATYNTAELGENIVQNGLITFENIGISSSSNYVVEAQDIENNKILLKVRALSNNPSLLSELTNNYSDLLRFRLTLSSLETPSILLDNIEMLENSQFIESSSLHTTKFECINISSIFSLTCPSPVITGFSPSPPLSLSAGVGDTLTIRGMCFDTIRGTSVVEFTDSSGSPAKFTYKSFYFS
jgi:hypothetical protein